MNEETYWERDPGHRCKDVMGKIEIVTDHQQAGKDAHPDKEFSIR